MYVVNICWCVKRCPGLTKVIVLHKAEVAYIFPHCNLLNSALVQGELLGHIDVTGTQGHRHVHIAYVHW